MSLAVAKATIGRDEIVAARDRTARHGKDNAAALVDECGELIAMWGVGQDGKAVGRSVAFGNVAYSLWISTGSRVASFRS